MSKHPSLKAAGRIRKQRNVLKRFERINILKQDGRWQEGQKVLSALPETKPEEKARSRSARLEPPGSRFAGIRGS